MVSGLLIQNSIGSIFNKITVNAVSEESTKIKISGSTMSNDFLSLSMSGTRFSINTTGGSSENTKDNNKKLLYGGDTSYTTINIDGTSIVYGDSNITETPVFDQALAANISAMNYSNVHVQQKVSLMYNTATGNDDTVEIKYTITNNDTISHQVGTRIMMDTMLGNNDDAPFRVPGIGVVTTEIEVSGNDIPQFWQAFYNLSSPSVIAQGSLLKDTTNPPDKVQFTNWSKIKESVWNYQVKPSSNNGDSAVSIIWQPTELAAGQTKTYTIYYGLSEFTQELTPPLAISVYMDGFVELPRVNNEIQSTEFDVVAYLENIGEADAKNAYIRINIPEEFTIYQNTLRHTYDNFETKKFEQISWTINVPATIPPGNYSVKIVCGADDVEEKEVTRYVEIGTEIKDNRIDWGY